MGFKIGHWKVSLAEYGLKDNHRLVNDICRSFEKQYDIGKLIIEKCNALRTLNAYKGSLTVN